MGFMLDQGFVEKKIEKPVRNSLPSFELMSNKTIIDAIRRIL
jgi:hypothetical protein